MGNLYISQKNKFRQAFTIVELLIVIAVIGILVAISTVAYNGIQQKARETALLSDLDNALSIVEHDLSANGVYPDTVESVDGGKGVPKSSQETEYQYIVDNVSIPPTFCLSGTIQSSSFHVSSSNDNPLPGLCEAVSSTNIAITAPIARPVNTAYEAYLNITTSATGAPTPTAQWQRLPKNTDSGTWIDIAGQTSSYISWIFTADYTDGDYGYFRVAYTNTSGTEISQPIRVTFYYESD